MPGLLKCYTCPSAPLTEVQPLSTGGWHPLCELVSSNSQILFPFGTQDQKTVSFANLALTPPPSRKTPRTQKEGGFASRNGRAPT